MKVISIYNQKGGVGKTTATVQMASWIAYGGGRVLAVDADIQANLTNALLSNSKYIEDEDYLGFGEAVDGQTDLESIIQTASIEVRSGLSARNVGIDVVPINKKREYKFFTSGPYAVKELFDKVKKKYDYILIDYPPERPYIGSIDNKDVFNLVALCLIATDSVITPCTPDEDSFSGLDILSEHINSIRKEYNPEIKNLGCFLNNVGKFDADKFIQEMCEGTFKDSGLYSGYAIPTSGIIKSSRLKYRPIAWYFSGNAVASEYKKLTEYVIGKKIREKKIKEKKIKEKKKKQRRASNG